MPQHDPAPMPRQRAPSGQESAAAVPAHPPRRLALNALGDWVGREVGVSDWLRISQDRIDRFAEATGDHQWIHVDVARAARSPYAGTIAHGFLTLSLIPMMRSGIIELEGAATTVNYGMNRLRFPSPVTVDSEIRGRFVLRSAKPARQGVLLTWQACVEIRGQDKPACLAELLTLAIPAAS